MSDKRFFGEMKMTKRSKKNNKSQAKVQGFVVVAFAKDMEQAREYETMLKVNDIPAVIGHEREQSTGTQEIAVMVPEDCLDEAHVVIESQDAYDDLCDFAAEKDEEEEEDFNFDGDYSDDDNF